MWFFLNKVILTKDKLAKRNWKGCKKCAFCDSEESIDHLLFSCPFERLMWTVVQYVFNITTLSKHEFEWGLYMVDKTLKARTRDGLTW